MGCEGIEPLVTTSTFFDAGFTDRHEDVVTPLPCKALGDDRGPLVFPLPSRHPADLARVVDAWPGLPPHIRAAVLALVESSGRSAA